MTQAGWFTVLGAVGGATLAIGYVSDAAERQRPVVVELGKGRYKCATLLQRYVAHLIDTAILVATILLPASICGLHEPAVVFSSGATTAAFALAYFVVCEACWGQTPGKRLVRIRVAAADGCHPDWRASVVRNLARVADTFFLGYAVGVVAWWRSPERQRLGDGLARTWVVAEGLVGEDGVPVRTPRAVPDPAAVQG